MALIDMDYGGEEDVQRRKRVQAPPLAPSAPEVPTFTVAPRDPDNPKPTSVTTAPQDFWVPPTASFNPNTPSGQVNAQNPQAQAGQSFVEAGDTGGYLGGTGVTIGAGRSVTPQAAQQQIAQAQSLNIPQDWITDFLQRNPGDTNRLAESYFSGGPRDDGGYDTNLPDPSVNALMAARQNPSFGQPFSAPQGQNLSFQTPGFQFDDPYTKLLEEIAQNQLNLLKTPPANPALDKLLAFLDSRFTELSTQPGYSPDELAMLRTQAIEPLEQDRQASQRRSLERTASRGMLPSSGLAELDSRDVDYQYDKLRGAVQRDLGVNAINRRDQDLNQAMTLGQLAGITIPQQQRTEDQQRRGETLALGSLLYDLPRRAMQDNLAVINGTPGSSDLFSQAVQLLNANQQQQQINNQQNAAYWASLGELFGELF